MSHRTKVMITREGCYYLGMLTVITAGAFIRDINLLYIMAGTMLGPLLFSYVAATRSLRRVHVVRRIAVARRCWRSVVCGDRSGQAKRNSAGLCYDRPRPDLARGGSSYVRRGRKDVFCADSRRAERQQALIVHA